jgi:hypothetical protein
MRVATVRSEVMLILLSTPQAVDHYPRIEWSASPNISSADAPNKAARICRSRNPVHIFSAPPVL